MERVIIIYQMFLKITKGFNVSFHADDVVFFFGAGASAPFGIPTMKQMVVDFERHLKDNGTEDEIEVYGDIKKTLEATTGETTDLEAVFTVIDGVINYSFERLGLLSLYTIPITFGDFPPSEIPMKLVTTCKNLKDKFQNFVREKCLIPDESFAKIPPVYQDLFNRFYKGSSRFASNTYHTRGNYHYCTWTIFTTNYDTCLEYYWRQVVRAPLNTGFRVDEARNTWVLNPDSFQREGLRLIKIHGSISWKIEPDGTVTEEQIMGHSLLGRQFVGEMMIYPVQQKELYLEPYISMFKLLNSELLSKTMWVIIGYSFNDPIIREIFIRNSNENKKIVLVHPNAQDIRNQKLVNAKGSFFLLNQKFGMDDYKEVITLIINNLKPPPVA